MDSQGLVWLSDERIVVNGMGTSFSTDLAISGTVDGELYQTIRFGVFQYEIP